MQVYGERYAAVRRLNMPAYKIHVTNVPWDVDYNHAVRFASASARHDYFSIDWTAAPLVNLDFGTGFRTSAVVTTENTRAASQYNYAVTYDVTNDLYYYYFVVRAEYLAANKYRYHLVCDVIQQTLFDITFGDCFIRRAHLNRWTVSDGEIQTVSLNFGTDSPFLTDDNVIQNYGKRLTSRSKLGINYQGSANVTNWINQNIKAWRYYYISVGSYKYTKFNDNTTFSYVNGGIVYGFNDQSTIGEWTVLCEPVYRTSFRIKLQLTLNSEGSSIINTYEWADNAFSSFSALNDGVAEAKVYAVKLSMIPPFVSLAGIDCAVVGGDLVFYTTRTTAWGDIPYINMDILPGQTNNYLLGFEFFNVFYSAYGYNYVIGGVSSQYLLAQDVPILQTYIPVSYPEVGTYTYASAKINSDYKDPILCSSKCIELKISIGTGEKQTFDYRFLGKAASLLKFYVFGILSPYTEIIYISPILTTGSSILADDDLYQSYFGYINKEDNTLSIAINEFSNFLAQQKNFYMAFQFNKSMDVTKMLANIGIGAATGGAPGDVVGGASGLISGIVGIYRDYQNTLLQIDNMQSAPEKLTNASGDILTNIGVSDLSVFAEVYECTDFAIDQVIDYVKKYGYAYNRLGNISTFLAVRKLWNYVQADVETVESTNTDNPIGVEMHDQIKTIFARGITFWTNPDGISDYSGQNYEVFLDGE